MARLDLDSERLTRYGFSVPKQPDTETHEIVSSHTVDRSEWPAGPWDAEPDRFQWSHAGLACLAIRSDNGAWCGYVGIPEGHPALMRDVDSWEVHGGITYGPSPCGKVICHVPEPGMPADVLWIGFDCAHCMDFWPSMNRRMPKELHFGPSDGCKYRDLAYVRNQAETLARQVVAVQ